MDEQKDNLNPIQSEQGESFGEDRMIEKETAPVHSLVYGESMRAKAVSAKNSRKKIRTALQIILLGILAFGVLQLVSDMGRYTPVADKPLSFDGFIAISYFGVERYDSEARTLIHQERLREHLAALQALGYTTVTQQQIEDYYTKGSPLPEKSLFLMFEDGRRDTAVFAHDILKKHNYIATAMTYGDRFEKQDSKFLSGRDIEALMETTYWELGTNGYRLEYINVYDRYRNFFGNLDSNEFVAVSPYLDRDYNHYLMDFIRDEDRLSTETLEEMSQRIGADYESMNYIYNNTIGFLPRLYALMHSNTERFGSDPYVSDVNEQYIRDMFTFNFNREGFCQNTAESSMYDLTRMQPQAHWYSNHLVMRVADDTGETAVFVVGDEEEAAKWELQLGAAEFRDDTIVLTSETEDYGRMLLPQALQQNLEVSVQLDGNVAGKQGIGLCADKSAKNSILVSVENGVLYVQQIRNGIAHNLYSLDLFEFDGGSAQSIEENEKEGVLAYGNAVLKYDKNYDKLRQANRVLDEWEETEVATLQDGGESYIPVIDLLDRGSRKLKVTLKGDYMTIEVDGRVAIRNLKVAGGQGYVYLESSPLLAEKYNQRNLTDDVYDGVFCNLKISEPDTGEIYYEYRLKTLGAAKRWLGQLFQNIANFFIETF